MNNESEYKLNEQSLEPSKLKAIITTEGPLLVIAGPGSGKTMTLVERIVYLIAEKNVKSENIMVSTFTEKAAKELITRVSNRILELDIRVNINEMYIGTLHSIFLKILEEFRDSTRLSRNYRMLDDFDQKFFVYNSIKEYEKIENVHLVIGEGKSSQWSKAETIVKYVNKIHEEMVNVDLLISSNNHQVKALGEIVQLYDELLKEDNCLDFSTIQLETLNTFQDNPEIVKQLQKKIHYIMVDEYQDTNSIQEKLLFYLLNPKSKNICVVGDDDQGLYRFRGASIRNILEFANNFDEGQCKRITLSTNFRSHPEIVNFYNKWMDQLDWAKGGKVFRFLKTIQPQDKEFIDNPSVVKVSSDGEAIDWYKEIYEFIVTLKEEDVLKDYNQIAFLCKSVKNEKSIDLANYLESKDINIFSPRSALFFERHEIQLIIGAFIFIFPDIFDTLRWNQNAHLDIWQYYEDCLRSFADAIRENKSKHKSLLSWCNEKAKIHLNYAEKNQKADYGLSSLFYELLQFPMFSEYCDSELKDTIFNLRAVYNLALFSKLLNKVEYLYNITVLTSEYYTRIMRNVFNRFFRFLHDGGIEEYEGFDEYAPSGCMSFMTIHQSKGLEFPIVFVDSLNLVPRKQYNELDEILQNEFYQKPPYEPIEETKNYDFWRLFYTAFSRPQDLLVLSGHENNGRGLGKLPSKYFEKSYTSIPSWRDPSFAISKLNLKNVKPVNIKHEYSFTSDILFYENCPFQYKFYKEIEFSPVRSASTMFGLLVHQTIEDVHKTVLKGHEQDVSKESIENWFNLNYNSLTKHFRTYLGPGQRKSALDQIVNYADRHKNEWHLLKEAEVDVSLLKDNYILKGVIDLVQGEENTVEIIDFKTEKEKPDVNDINDREKLNRYRRQLEIYAHIVEEKTEYSVSKMHLYYTGEQSGNPYITYDREAESIDKTVGAFDSVVANIENKNFDKSSIKMCYKLCGNCDMRFYCGWS